jgi:fructokinase
MRCARIGVDLGGTKIEGLVLAHDGTPLARLRIATPRNSYADTITAITRLVDELERRAGTREASVGIGVPGSLSPASGLIQNANSTWLNGRPFDRDLAVALGRPVRLANDADCFALSEAVDGAGAGARSVLGVILGTGCGGGLVYEGKLIEGRRGIAGEWGHNPLPWAEASELPGPPCWCGKPAGCIESWVSGPGLANDHVRSTGQCLTAEEIAAAARGGDAAAKATLERHASRLARALAHVVNIFDPEVIVLGGGLSQLDHLYADLPRLAAPFVFAERADLVIRPPRWGDAGGVRGAAWLWGGPLANPLAAGD